MVDESEGNRPGRALFPSVSGLSVDGGAGTAGGGGAGGSQQREIISPSAGLLGRKSADAAAVSE
jgi:hypothetical protein